MSETVGMQIKTSAHAIRRLTNQLRWSRDGVLQQMFHVEIRSTDGTTTDSFEWQDVPTEATDA